MCAHMHMCVCVCVSTYSSKQHANLQKICEPYATGAQPKYTYLSFLNFPAVSHNNTVDVHTCEAACILLGEALNKCFC
jgi:hypothetical protein